MRRIVLRPCDGFFGSEGRQAFSQALSPPEAPAGRTSCEVRVSVSFLLVSAWLSYWNKKTRRLNEARLAGEVVEGIYVPWGKSLIKKGDTIYCFFIEGKDVHLVTRVKAASVSADPDLEHQDSVTITPEPSGIKASYSRTVKKTLLSSIEYWHKDRAPGRSLEDPDATRFQGPNSVRELASGAQHLDAAL